MLLSWENPAKLALTAWLRTSLLVGEKGGTSRVSISAAGRVRVRKHVYKQTADPCTSFSVSTVFGKQSGMKNMIYKVPLKALQHMSWKNIQEAAFQQDAGAVLFPPINISALTSLPSQHLHLKRVILLIFYSVRLCRTITHLLFCLHILWYNLNIQSIIFNYLLNYW